MTTKTKTSEVDKIANQKRREYNRHYYARNKQRMRNYQVAYWQRKAEAELNKDAVGVLHE